MVIIDDHSNAVEARPTRAKSEAFEVVRSTVAVWERQFEKPVKIIRSDGDTVLLSDKALEWYERTGIRHQVTPRYTPELNGKAERTIRTIKEGIRAMIHSSGLGHAYWDYAAQYQAVILNKISTDSSGITPWEKLTGRYPNIKSIRAFGSRIAFMV